MNEINIYLKDIGEYYGIDTFFGVFVNYAYELYHITNKINTENITDDLKNQLIIKIIDIELVLDVIKSKFIEDNKKINEIYNNKIYNLMEGIK